MLIKIEPNTKKTFSQSIGDFHGKKNVIDKNIYCLGVEQEKLNPRLEINFQGCT
jgi:hypothetical protein